MLSRFATFVVGCAIGFGVPWVIMPGGSSSSTEMRGASSGVAGGRADVAGKRDIGTGDAKGTGTGLDFTPDPSVAVPETDGIPDMPDMGRIRSQGSLVGTWSRGGDCSNRRTLLTLHAGGRAQFYDGTPGGRWEADGDELRIVINETIIGFEMNWQDADRFTGPQDTIFTRC